jgi:hypothetical protein
VHMETLKDWLENDSNWHTLSIQLAQSNVASPIPRHTI